MSELELIQQPKAVAVQRPLAANNIAEMLQAVIQKGVTGENVAALDSLVNLYQKVRALDAEAAFTAAFNALQAEMPKVMARQAVPNNDGTVRYKFAPYEKIMEQVAPLLQLHGFTVAFSTKYTETTPVRLIKMCTLQHVAGHSRTTEFAVRIGSGPPKATESQADGAAGTYAKRFALCDALNIVIGADTDAAAEGGYITPAQAKDLEARVKSTGSREEYFLKFAGAEDYAHIRAGKYSVLDENLRKKERTA